MADVMAHSVSTFYAGCKDIDNPMKVMERPELTKRYSDSPSGGFPLLLSNPEQHIHLHI
jgi:hypothetical protein